MKKNIAIILFFIGLCHTMPSFGQGIAVNTTGAPSDANALLDVNAPNKGILIPRIDYANRPLTGVLKGTLMFVTANGPDGNNGFYYYDGAAWVRFYHIAEQQNLSLSNDTLNITSSNYVDLSDVFPVAGDTKCGKSYYNLLTDNSHCGSCAIVCPGGQTCTNGTCH